jgi:hypothetical protein
VQWSFSSIFGAPDKIPLAALLPTCGRLVSSASARLAIDILSGALAPSMQDSIFRVRPISVEIFWRNPVIAEEDGQFLAQ